MKNSKSDRSGRMGEALRANLRRRKQDRAPVGESGADGQAGGELERRRDRLAPRIRPGGAGSGPAKD